MLYCRRITVYLTEANVKDVAIVSSERENNIFLEQHGVRAGVG